MTFIVTRLKNNILVLAAAFVVFCGVLSACESTPTTVPETGTAAVRSASPTPEQTVAPTPRGSLAPIMTPVASLDVNPDELRGVSVKFWHSFPGETGKAIQSLVMDFNADNGWGIRVQPAYQGNLDELSANLEQSLKTGDAPDLVVGYVYQAQEWNTSRKIVDLSEYVKDSVWGFSSQEQSDFYPGFWEQDVVAGKRFGIPSLGSGQMLFYNQTWARALGFSQPPATPSQFSQQACAAAKANLQDDNPDNDQTGGWIVSTDYSAMLGWISAFGGDAVNQQGDAYQFDTSQVEDTFNFLRGLYDEGCAWLSASDAPYTEFATRRGLFATGSVSDIPYQAAAFDNESNKDQWTVIPFPSPVNKPAIDVYAPAYEVLSSTPEEQLATWLFIKWMVSPENQAVLAKASSAFPVRSTALDDLEAYGNSHPAWASAVDLLQLARSEPSFRSWSTVRWAVHDAATQLFRSYFTIDQVPNLAKLLDETAADLHSGAHD